MRAVTVCALAALLVAYSSAAPEFVGEFESFKAKFQDMWRADDCPINYLAPHEEDPDSAR